MTKIEKLAESVIIERLKDLQGWEYNADKQEIYKEFKFKGYYKTIAFVNSIAWYAQKLCHHPDLLVSFGKCKVHLTTHDANGISEKDFELAKILENL